MNSFLIVQAKCTRYRAVKVLHTCRCHQVPDSDRPYPQWLYSITAITQGSYASGAVMLNGRTSGKWTGKCVGEAEG
jgi:hypothetical protein